MKAEVTIKYNPEDNEYIVDSKQLEKYRLQGSRPVLEYAVEEFLVNLENRINSYEAGGQDSEFPDMRKLYGLLLEFKIPADTPEDETLYLKAMNLMMKRHYGQKDKAGRDYYFHPVRVARRCMEIEDKIVALLHDTIEDTGLTLDDLFAEGFIQKDIIDGLVSVTRGEYETYAEFIERAAEDYIGHEVKMHDLEDNMNITRLPDLKEKDWRRLNKYLHAWRYLKGLEKDTSLIVE